MRAVRHFQNVRHMAGGRSVQNGNIHAVLYYVQNRCHQIAGIQSHCFDYINCIVSFVMVLCGNVRFPGAPTGFPVGAGHARPGGRRGYPLTGNCL